MDENKTTSNNGIKTIHTYTSDMADAVRQNEASVIKIALAEKEKREREVIYKEAEGTTVSKIFWVLGGIILIGGAIVGGYFLFKKNQENVSVSKPVVNIPAIISYDDKAFIDASEKKTSIEFADLIKPEVEKIGKVGSIKSIFITKNTNGTNALMPVEDLNRIFDLTAPAPLIRTLSGEYMIGTYTTTDTEPKPHLFLIYKVKDFNQAYASMLAWEKTMLHDMFIPFNIDLSGDRSVLLDKQWKDIVINNKDARILYDKDGNDVLFYAFLSKDTFVITDNKDVIKELNIRILAKSTKPL